jgi:hypothetical protein
MKHLYACNILKHPYIKTEDDVKNLINILNTTPNWIVNKGESYVIRRTLSGTWVWDKLTRNTVDIGGRLYDNNWIDKFNTEKLDKHFYEVGRNPNKGFLMIDNTLWTLCAFDTSIKGRNLKRLNIPENILTDISNEIGFDTKKQYPIYNIIHYVDKDTVEANLQNITNHFNDIVVNFHDSFKIPIYISKHQNIQLESEEK